MHMPFSCSSGTAKSKEVFMNNEQALEPELDS
jgi:hypothetical protein